MARGPPRARHGDIGGAAAVSEHRHAESGDAARAGGHPSVRLREERRASRTARARAMVGRGRRDCQGLRAARRREARERCCSLVEVSLAMACCVPAGGWHAVAGAAAGTGAAIATAILIGDRAGLDQEVEERLQRAGTFHVIAISGGNIAILTALILGLLRLVGLPPRTCAWLTISVVGIYAFIVGSGASVARASLAAIVYLFARAIDHRTPPVNVLAVVVAVMLVWAPLEIVDAGFWLTCLATLAIMLLAQRLADRAKSALRRITSDPLEEACVDVSAGAGADTQRGSLSGAGALRHVSRVQTRRTWRHGACSWLAGDPRRRIRNRSSRGDDRRGSRLAASDGVRILSSVDRWTRPELPGDPADDGRSSRRNRDRAVCARMSRIGADRGYCRPHRRSRRSRHRLQFSHRRRRTLERAACRAAAVVAAARVSAESLRRMVRSSAAMAPPRRPHAHGSRVSASSSGRCRSRRSRCTRTARRSVR